MTTGDAERCLARVRALAWVLVLAVAFATACGDAGAVGDTPAMGMDSGTDRDAGGAGREAGSADAQVDAKSAAGDEDAGKDEDAGSADAGGDASFDSGLDAGADASLDAGPSDPSGSYALSIGTVTDPCAHRGFTGDPPSTITITMPGPGMYRITGSAPWVTLMGTIDESTGAASLVGTGVVAGYLGVTCSFVGTILNGMLAGTLSWGDGNELPSCGGTTDYSIKFMLGGTRQ